MQSFYNTMLSNRIAEIIQRGNAPFLGASIGVGGMVRGYAGYSLSATAKPNQEEEALEAVIRENERVIQHGFTESELDRVKTNMLTSLRSMLKDVDKTNNELKVVEKYMPKQLSVDDVKKIVTETVQQVGAASMKDFGKVMGAVMPKVKGQADGKLVNQTVKETLSNL